MDLPGIPARRALVDSPRIELGIVQCECTGMPFTYEPARYGRRGTRIPAMRMLCSAVEPQAPENRDKYQVLCIKS